MGEIRSPVYLVNQAATGASQALDQGELPSFLLHVYFHFRASVECWGGGSGSGAAGGRVLPDLHTSPLLQVKKKLTSCSNFSSFSNSSVFLVLLPGTFFQPF